MHGGGGGRGQVEALQHCQPRCRPLACHAMRAIGGLELSPSSASRRLTLSIKILPSFVYILLKHSGLQRGRVLHEADQRPARRRQTVGVDADESSQRAVPRAGSRSGCDLRAALYSSLREGCVQYIAQQSEDLPVLYPTPIALLLQ